MNQKIEKAISALFRTERATASEIAFEGVSAVRVGRNEVWRLTSISDGDFVFVKFTGSIERLQRECAGIRVAKSLASGNQKLCAPEVLLADENVCAIVTRGLSGCGLDKILRNAFRIDCNLLHRKAPIEYAIKCINAATHWLGQLHKQPIEANASFYDHSIRGTLTRIEKKMDRAVKLTTSRRTELSNLSTKFSNIIPDAREVCVTASLQIPPTDATLVFGDPTPGNILLGNGSVGMVDYEDFGVGDPARDWTVLMESLFPKGGRWKRWKTNGVADSIRIPYVSPRKVTFFRVEFALDRLNWQLALGAARRKVEKALNEFHSDLQCLTQLVQDVAE